MIKIEKKHQMNKNMRKSLKINNCSIFIESLGKLLKDCFRLSGY